jgi:hypothetical protein
MTTPSRTNPTTSVTTAYKFLAPGAIGPISRFAWPQPDGSGAGAWIEVDGQLDPCRRGIHVCAPDQLAHWLHEELWRIEIDGVIVDGIDCQVVSRARLLAPVWAWSAGGAQRFAVAVRDRAAHLIETRPLEEQAWLEGYVLDASLHVNAGRPESPALAGLCASVGIARSAPAEEQEAIYRAERAWQSAWIAEEMGLG